MIALGIVGEVDKNLVLNSTISNVDNAQAALAKAK